MTDPVFLVVAGSVRPQRRSPAIAAWVGELARARPGAPPGAAFEVVDLRELGLGLDDEPGLPALGDYRRETTRAWGARVQACAGLAFVTPQYNWGYPAALKNAVDHLHREWRGKPTLVISYGGHGGGKASAQLREVLEGVHARVAEAAPGLRLARARIEADDGRIDPAGEFADHRAELEAALDAWLALARDPA